MSNYQDDENVLLNDEVVSTSKTLVPHRAVVTVANCRFRFDYHPDALNNVTNETIEEEEGETEVRFTCKPSSDVLNFLQVVSQSTASSEEKENSKSVVCAGVCNAHRVGRIIMMTLINVHVLL